MVNYVKVKIMFRYIIEPLTFNRLVNGSIQCCTGYMWNNTLEDCIGTKGFQIRFILLDLTISLITEYAIDKDLLTCNISLSTLVMICFINIVP